MVTIKDVAKLAGLSVSTTSNALNGKYGVKPETRRRAIEAAEQLQYVPNRIAQSLVTNTTRNINVILSGPSVNILTNPAFVDIINSTTTTLSDSHYRAILNICDSEKEIDILQQIGNNGSSDAIILIVSRRTDAELLDMLDKVRVPIVVAGRRLASDKMTSVSANNTEVGFMATKYLLEMGHKRIGFIGAWPGHKLAEERLQGYRQALKQYGVDYDESLVVEGAYDQLSGFIGAGRLLQQSSRSPDAIFAASDMMALGVMECLKQQGLRVPEDVSLIGCDNIPNLHLLHTPLTTISIPYKEIGRIAASTVIRILEDREFHPQRFTVESELRIRASVSRMNS